MAEGHAPEVSFDHHAPDFVHSNYDVYRKLRAACPVAHTASHGGFWVVTGYDEVFQIARDDHTFSSAKGGVIPPTTVGRLLPIQADPPALERYRRLLNPFLTPSAIKPLEPWIARIVDDAIDGFIEAGHADLVLDLANPIPAQTTMHLLGLDPAEWRLFADPLHQVMYTRPGSAENDDGQRHVLAFSEKIVGEVEERVRKPRDDMISRLLVSEFEGTKTSFDEVCDLVRMVIFGGMDTVVAALGNIFLRLDQYPEVRRRLVGDRTLLPTAVEEFLRFDAPIQGFGRLVTTDTVVGDRRVKAGEWVFMVWASANRDEKLFGEDSDRLRIDRAPNRHMTFGIGGHRCQGSTLARTELRIVVDRLLERLPDFKVLWDRVVGPETIGSSYGQREVPVTFTPGAKVERPAETGGDV
jgi:cytochrome P450